LRGFEVDEEGSGEDLILEVLVSVDIEGAEKGSESEAVDVSICAA